MSVFDLVATLTLDSSGYEEGLENAGKSASGFGKSVKRGLGTVAKVGGASLAAIGTAAAGATTALVAGVGNVASYGDNIDKMSQKMGISAEAYQEWDAVMQHSGTSMDSMSRGMMTLQSKAVSSADAFGALGIAQEDVANMSTEELFAATIKGLQGMEEGAERTALAQELLGSAAKELGPLLNTSAEDTEAMKLQVHALGGVMSDEAVKASAAYQDSLQDMNTALGGLTRGMLTEFMPGITTVMDGLTELFSGNSEAGIGLITSGVSSIADGINEALPGIISAGSEIATSLLNVLIENLPALVEMGTTLLVSLISGIISAIPTLVSRIPEIITAILTALSDAGPQLIAAGGELLGMIQSGIDGVVADFQSFISGVWDTVKSNATEAWENIKTAITDPIDSARSLVSSTVSRIRLSVTTAFNTLKSRVTTTWNNIKSAITTPIDNAKQTVSDAIDAIKGFFPLSIGKIFSNIKKPKFSFTPGTPPYGILGVGEPPTLKIDWVEAFAKAQKAAYVLDGATIFGAMGGKALLGGERGREIVMSYDKLAKMMGGNSTFNIVVNAAPGMDENAVADAVARKLQRQVNRREAVWA